MENFAVFPFSTGLRQAVESEHSLMIEGISRHCGGNWRGSRRQAKIIQDFLYHGRRIDRASKTLRERYSDALGLPNSTMLPVYISIVVHRAPTFEIPGNRIFCFNVGQGAFVCRLRGHMANEICLAVKSGSVDDVKQAMANSPGSINTGDEYEMTPLWLAARAGNLALVKLLVESGASIDLRGNKITRSTPLSVAVVEAGAADPARCDEYRVVVEYLLKAGADPQARDYANQTPLSYANMRTHLSAIADHITYHIDLKLRNRLEEESKRKAENERKAKEQHEELAHIWERQKEKWLWVACLSTGLLLIGLFFFGLNIASNSSDFPALGFGLMMIGAICGAIGFGAFFKLRSLLSK
jgi:hypothetical protein